jgi:transcriptional regulator with XRE-family HTH domain
MTLDVEGARVPQFTMADRLRKAREVAGLGQDELARELGVSRNTVGNYEAERVQPRRAVLMAWAMRTQVPLAWLLNGENPRQDGGPDGGSRDVRPKGFEPPTF